MKFGIFCLLFQNCIAENESLLSKNKSKEEPSFWSKSKFSEFTKDLTPQDFSWPLWKWFIFIILLQSIIYRVSHYFLTNALRILDFNNTTLIIQNSVHKLFSNIFQIWILLKNINDFRNFSRKVVITIFFGIIFV